MALRRRLAFLAACGMLLAGMLVVAAPTAVAGDIQCDSNPEACARLTVVLKGYGRGDAWSAVADGSVNHDGKIECHRVNNATTGTCGYDYYIVQGGTRNIRIQAAVFNQLKEQVCDTNGNNCEDIGGVDTVISRGGRYTVTFTMKLTDRVIVNVSKAGAGTGTITSDPTGISCGGTCMFQWASGTSINVTAAATGGSTFGGWDAGGPCAGQGATCNLANMSGDKSVVATFTAPATPPASVPASNPATATPTATATPPASVAPSATPVKTATPSTAASFKPPTQIPATPLPPGVTQDPNATPIDLPSGAASTAPNLGPTPTPFKFTTDDPNRTQSALGGQSTQPPVLPTGDIGAGPPWVVIGLIVLLGVLVGGGAFWWARRRNGARP